MNDLINLVWKDLLPLVFVFIRIAVVFSLVPFFGAEIMPRRLATIIALFLSLIILPVIPPLAIDIQRLNLLTLLMYMLHEVLLGISIGLAVQVIFAGVQIAGELMGFSMGFAIVNVIDPMTGTEAPVTANFLYIIAFLLFIIMDGHHMFIKAIQESAHRHGVVPAGFLPGGIDLFHRHVRYRPEARGAGPGGALVDQRRLGSYLAIHPPDEHLYRQLPYHDLHGSDLHDLHHQTHAFFPPGAHAQRLGIYHRGDEAVLKKQAQRHKGIEA